MIGLSRSKPRQGALLLSQETWALHLPAQEPEAVGGGGWRPKDAEGIAEDILEALGGVANAELLVALRSELCLTASFSAPSPRSVRNRSTLLYQMEDLLPIAAEEVAADFVTRKLEVFGVCCELAWLEPLVEALARRGFVVRVVTPLALLALADLTGRRGDPGSRLVALEESGKLDLLETIDQKLVDWRCLPNDSESLARALHHSGLKSGVAPPVARAGDVALPEGFEGELLETEHGLRPVLAAALRTASRVLAGYERAAIDLMRGVSPVGAQRRSPLHRELLLLQASVLGLILALCFYASRTAALANDATERAAVGQADAFRSVFPDKRIPVGVRSRLASEHRRLKGVRGEDGATPEPVSAVAVVQQAIAALPEAMRFRLLELRVDGDKLYLEGQARSYADADRLAASLRRRGFEVPPPITQQLPDRGVDFRMTAEWSSGKEGGS